ncbi:MAG: oxidoreductase [Bryobacteraceae bacterium]|nr:oxidoreductase [Bryobacteraceae bacterium]MDW8380306.1 MDR family oxidoreductase [Bryobacterales bacterium]
MASFRAFVVRQADGQTTFGFEQLDASLLTFGDVLIRVEYSSLNYKDGLAVTGKPGVIRSYPMIPGIDLAGEVMESASEAFKPGQKVVVTGCGTSETIWGGYAQMARMKADHVVAIPPGFSTRQAMGIGTAGFTAMQCVMALESHGLRPGGSKPVVVTGAAGGVGSVAVAILAKLGYSVVASTGRPEAAEYLKSLGAAEILDRSVLAAPSSKPLESERWAAAVDTAGGDTLAGVIRTLSTGASVAACGVAGGPKLQTTVFPFILRGVNLLGIDSVRVPQVQRKEIWSRLATDLPLDKLESMITVEPLSKIQELGTRILAGQTRGRIVIDVNA